MSILQGVRVAPGVRKPVWNFKMTYNPGPSAAPSRPASGGASPRPARRPAAAAGRSRKSNVKSSDKPSGPDDLLSRYSSKKTAWKLLETHDAKLAKRLRHCGYVARAFSVDLVGNAETGKAGLLGLKSCHSVFCCPACAPRIAAKRKDELDKLLAGARQAGLAPVMLTLTAAHSRATRLAPFLDALKRAKKRMRERQEWKRLPFAGSVTATEVTFGANGHHPHFHEIILLDCPAADAVQHMETLRAVWLRCLEAFGLTGNQAAFHVQPAAAVGQYVGKFAAACEVALSGNKQGRKGSRTPWQLLADAGNGDRVAAAAWIEFALAFRGKRQLVFSPGLKARFGIDEKEDAELAGEVDPVDAAQLPVLRSWFGCSSEWKAARKRRCQLVHAARSGGDLDAAEFGLPDNVLWHRMGGDAVLEPSD